MKYTIMATMKNTQILQLVLALLMFLTHTRAKKLCDVRIWYLNIITADVFNADLSDEQMSLKESIEALVMNSADNRDTRMVDCNVLYMYNDMLNEQFNYVSSSGMAMKEVDSKNRQTSDDNDKDTVKENINKDRNEDSVNEDSVNGSANEEGPSDTNGELNKGISEHGNENDGNLNHDNERTNELQEKNNEPEFGSQQMDSDSLSQHQDDNINTKQYSEEEPTNMDIPSVDDTLKDEHQDNGGHNINIIDETDVIDNGVEDNDAPNQFIDLSNEYTEGSDDTEIDDSETDNEAVEHNVDLTDKVDDNISESKNKSSIRRRPIALGVCWSLGCSTYDIFVFNTKDANTSGTVKQKDPNTIRPSRHRLRTKKSFSHNSCTLIYFYELLFLNTVCVSNYSIDEPLQKRAILENDINTESLPDSEHIQDMSDSSKLPEVPESDNKQEVSESHSSHEELDENEIDNMKKINAMDAFIPLEANGNGVEENEAVLTEDVSSDYKPEIDIVNKREPSEIVNSDSVINGNILKNTIDTSRTNEDNVGAEEALDPTVDIDIPNRVEAELGNEKNGMKSFQEFEKIIEQKTNKYYNKIQSLEVMIMKLENTLLSEALHKQNHSSTITKLENHILKLENELLKMNKNYQNFRDEADNMSKRQNKYLELAYKQQAKQDYPELPDHTTKSHELISQHQSKLNELAFVLKNQSKMIMLLQEKYESLEDQNRQLHQMVMNQTIFMTSIIKTVQDLSEQNIQNQKEIIALKQKVDEHTNKQTQIEATPGKEHSKTEDVIDELDSLLFHNRDEKIHFVPTKHHTIEKNKDNAHNSDVLLQKYMMNKKSTNEVVSGWCPKSINTCPLCQRFSLVKKNCIPFQFLIWSYGTQTLKQEGSEADKTVSASSPKSKTNEPYFTAEHFADDDLSRVKDTQLHDLTASLGANPDLKEIKESKEVHIENNVVYQDEIMIDTLSDVVTDAEGDSNIDEKSNHGSMNNNIADKNEYTEEAPIENNHIYDDMYEHMGYDKEGKPVWKMRVIELIKVDTQEEIKVENEDSESLNDKKSKTDSISTDKENIINNVDGVPEEVHEETDPRKTTNTVDKTNADANIKVDNIPMMSSENNKREQLDGTKYVLKSNENIAINKENAKDNAKDKPEKIYKETRPSKDSHKEEHTRADANIELNSIPNRLNEPSLDETKTNQEMNKVDKQINLDPGKKEAHATPKENLKEDLIKDSKIAHVSKLKTDELSKDSPEKVNTLTDNKGTVDTVSKIMVKQNTEEENLKRDSDGSKTHKTEETVSEDLSKQKPKTNETNKGETPKEIKSSEEKKPDNQQQKVDMYSQEKDVIDSNRNVNATKTVPSKAKEAANKPKERKVPINLDQTVYEPKDCYDYYTRGDKRDGIYKVKPAGSERTLEVFCDMRKGGWTVIQRRQDGYTNFFQEWSSYKKGFGGLYGEHWLGNDNIHLLTNQGYYKLHVDLMDWDKVKKYAEFDYFLVESEAEGYRVHIDGYQGDAGDGLTKHDGHKFSTKDVDNDKVVKEFGGSCAKRFYGAGWYYKCYASNLNGKYYKGGKIPEKKYDGVTWKPWTGPNYSLKKVEMKIRPASAKK